ncbi:MAG: chemotaxis protein CheD [Ignavibacteria bacterium]|jgi:chemotaxis protein CheD
MKKKINKENVTFLHPGNAIITNKNKVIYTVLGSCIAVTMYVPRLRIGAMIHCLLPSPGGKEDRSCSDCFSKFKYISCAIPLVFKSLEKFYIDPREVEVKIFGGANLIFHNRNNNTANTIGQKNINLANKIILEKNLEIKSFDTGGNIGRKIYFLIESGEVYLKRIKKNEYERLKMI